MLVEAKEMQSAVRLAKENQVRIGAHPGFPDRENFGRTQMDLPDQELLRICVISLVH